MRKLLVLTMVLIIALVPNMAYATENDTTSINNTGIVSKYERDLEHYNQLKEQLQKLGLDEEDIGISLSNDKIVLRNDIKDYKHVYGKAKLVSNLSALSGQPRIGSRFQNGGGLYYALNGGGSASVGVSFPSPYGSFSVSIPIGKLDVSGGYFTNVPNKTDFFILKVKQTYEVKPYIIYHREQNDAGQYTWKKFSSGITKAFYSQEPICIKVS